MKVKRIIKVKNKLGLHLRPASFIAKLLKNVKSNVLFTHRGETVNAKSIMGILILAATKNSKVLVTIEGEDAKETLKKLVLAFKNKLGE